MNAPQRPATGALGPPVLLPTTVIGSYSVPEWLGQLKNDYYRHRISRRYLDEIHEMAIKAAVMDQQQAGIDIVSDGELRRDNDVDYLLARIPGVEIAQPDKADYFDYFDATLSRELPAPGQASLGLAEDFRFVRQLTDRPVKLSITGPYSLARRIRVTAGAYPDHAGLVRALARALAAEAAELARAGARMLQIDEPFLAGYPEDVGLAVEAVNIVTDGADVSWTLHVCYGNRYARPLWEGHYDFLFPAVKEANVDQLALEFARTGDEDLSLLEEHHWDRRLGLGVIDVKTEQVESPDLVAARIRRALRFVPPDKLVINPDCGLRHLLPDVARAKLAAMVAGAAIVRAEIAQAVPSARAPAASAPPASVTHGVAGRVSAAAPGADQPAAAPDKPGPASPAPAQHAAGPGQRAAARGTARPPVPSKG
jgi:5-methyltetrahydropteroyltriglutamate--homocysteine methyltransferase